MDFQLNDESGVLFEGFELEPLIRQPWHPPYYQQRCEQAGLTKAMDLFSYALDIGNRAEDAAGDPRVRRAGADQPRDPDPQDDPAPPPLRSRRVRQGLQRRLVAQLGFRPATPRRISTRSALNYQLVFDGDWFMIAENDTETVAAAITIPDINQVLKKMKGRLLPLGWWYYLNKYKLIDRLRVGFLGVLPEYQHTGVAAELYMEHFDGRRAHPPHATARPAGSSRPTAG